MDGGKGSLITYRWAHEDEWRPTMMMVWKTFMKFESVDYTSEGIRHFFEFITDDDIYKAFLGGTYQVMLACDGERIVGMASLRSGNRLSLLFVDEDYHRRGIGTGLLLRTCAYLRDEVGEETMVVSSSPYAVGFYKKVGFRATGDERFVSGIRITPMEKDLF